MTFDWPWQTVDDDAVNAPGCDAGGFTVTEVAADCGLVQPLAVAVTV